MSEQKTTMTDGTPVDPGHREIDPKTGKQKGYIVLSEEERAKGFVRPVRQVYVHRGVRPKHPTRELTDEEKEKNPGRGYVIKEEYPESESPMVGRYWTEEQLKSGCNTETVMAQSIAETYARDPEFYGATYCSTCKGHFPVDEFVWKGTDIKVGA